MTWKGYTSLQDCDDDAFWTHNILSDILLARIYTDIQYVSKITEKQNKN